jgi:hypothetical protein
MLQRKTSLPKSTPLPKHVLASKLSRAWSRIVDGLDGGRHELAAHLSVSSATIENALSGKNVPETLTVINSLTIDSTALDEVFRELGFCVIPIRSEAANDLMTAAGVVKAMGDLIGRLEDGIRCHNDTLAVAALLRPHMPALEAIIADADRLRGAA